MNGLWQGDEIMKDSATIGLSVDFNITGLFFYLALRYDLDLNIQSKIHF